jgi:hypothetical protein
LRRIPAIVSFLNPQPALILVCGNRSSCPTADLRGNANKRPCRVERRPPFGSARTEYRAADEIIDS